MAAKWMPPLRFPTIFKIFWDDYFVAANWTPFGSQFAPIIFYQYIHGIRDRRIRVVAVPAEARS